MIKMKRNPGTGRINTVVNKGSEQALFPSRAAVNKVLKGNPWERSIGNYAKLTPSGAKGPRTYQDILNMAQNTTKVS